MRLPPVPRLVQHFGPMYQNDMKDLLTNWPQLDIIAACESGIEILNGSFGGDHRQKESMLFSA